MCVVNYYFGNCNNSYENALSALATTKVNSYKTSSIPLADFWRPTKELAKFIKKLADCGLEISYGDRCFEYPTPCVDKKGKELKYSRPSMTDLMIINDDLQVAIEGKYTEYSESNYETIKEWNPNNEPHKTDIKKQWFEYIRACGATIKNVDELDENIPYQFLHRAASACYNCKAVNKKPVLVYQLFFDDSNKKKKDEFVGNLKQWARQLGFTAAIKFYIVEVEVKNITEVKDNYNGIHSDIFLIMREKKAPVYKFDWENIKVIQV